MEKRKVIFVTDGDKVARKAVEIATSNIGGRCISSSAGNPTPISGQEIIQLIKKADHDPIVIMVDDKGMEGPGKGEKAMEIVARDSNVDVLGVVAVSSNGRDCDWLNVSCSITKHGNVIEGSVDKFGNDKGKAGMCGDTLSVLKDMKNLVIVGIGDPGRMDYYDLPSLGAPITTKALQEIIVRSGYKQ